MSLYKTIFLSVLAEIYASLYVKSQVL